MSLIKGLQKATSVNPGVTIIYSLPKVGKTEALSKLPNHLFVDADGSCSFYDCNYVSVKDLNTFKQLVVELKKLKETSNSTPFTYIILDTITYAMEGLIREYAVALYNKEEADNKPLDWDITVLPYGKGQTYLREAVKRVIDKLKEFCDYLIITGHVADKSITKEGKDLLIKDLDLVGKLKNILAAKVDALGLLYRKEKNKNVISFIHDEEEVLGGTRSKHLNGREILISELDSETGELTTYWDKIFINN